MSTQKVRISSLSGKTRFFNAFSIYFVCVFYVYMLVLCLQTTKNQYISNGSWQFHLLVPLCSLKLWSSSILPLLRLTISACLHTAPQYMYTHLLTISHHPEHAKVPGHHFETYSQFFYFCQFFDSNFFFLRWLYTSMHARSCTYDDITIYTCLYIVSICIYTY